MWRLVFVCASDLFTTHGTVWMYFGWLMDWLLDWLAVVVIGLFQLFYILIASLLIVLLARPELFDSFHCTDDVAVTKPTFNASTTTALFEKHHLRVLSLRNLDKGLVCCRLSAHALWQCSECLCVCSSMLCCSIFVMRESVDEFTCIRLMISGRMIKQSTVHWQISTHCNITRSHTSLIDKLSTVSHEYRLEIGTKKTKVLLASTKACWQVHAAAGVKRRKLQYFGHVVRADILCTHILHGVIAGNRCQGRHQNAAQTASNNGQVYQLQSASNMWETDAPWGSLVSMSVTSDPQTQGGTKAREGSTLHVGFLAKLHDNRCMRVYKNSTHCQLMPALLTWKSSTYQNKPFTVRN